jgi:adenylate cyclase
MSAVTAVAESTERTSPVDAAAAVVRRMRGMNLGRSQRLRLLLLVGAAVLATLLPLALAAADALRPLGVGVAGTSFESIALIVAFGLLAPFASLRLSSLRVLLIGSAAAVVLALVAGHRVDGTMMLSLAYPALALGLSVVATLAAQHVMVEFEHEHQRMMCTRFVPEQVVEQVLSRTDVNVGLGGIEVAGTIMFVDLRGFTTFAESRPAGQVIRILNHYLSDISCAILANDGTVVSYLGDGLMAVFGAPIEQGDHADRALAAAREILYRRLPRCNAWARAEGLCTDGFRIGIGINSGSFIAGNVGSERRLEYTAIGDAANTAARIQELTKAAGKMLLMSHSTCACLSSEPEDLVRVGDFDVRGKREKVELWSLAHEPSAGVAQLAAA